MSLKPGLQVILLSASSKSDLKYSGRNLSITGATRPICLDRITSVKQEKYRAEVVQVVTVGDNAYTPQASTRYAIEIGDPLRRTSGGQESERIFGYTTPSDLTTIGANAAVQREYIHGVIVAKINAAKFLYVTSISLGTGTGFTVTDAAGYYPAPGQNSTNRKGPSLIFSVQNGDGSGFAKTQVTVTTAAVIPFGNGAKLAAYKLVIDAMHSNVISGDFTAPSNADGVSGQNYDGFRFETLELASIPTITGHQGFVTLETIVYVDNGTGTSTANLAGFKSFERGFLNLIWKFHDSPSTIAFMGETAAISQGLNTGLPSGVAQAENVVSFGNGYSAHYSPIATSTLVALASTNDGLGLILDSTASEGVELSAPTWANSEKEFVVGKTPFSCYAKIKIDDVSGLNPMWVGFRKKEAYGATFAAYADYAAVGLGNATGDIYTTIEVAGGGNTNTDTTVNWADTETHTLEVRVDINGVAKFYVDGYQVNTATSYTFTAGLSIIPTIYALQTSDIGTPSLLEWFAIPSFGWRADS